MKEDPRKSDHLIEWLAAHDAPCPACNYNLRALKAPVCPECGAPLYLTVGSANVAPGPWLMGVLSFALGLGFDGVVTAMAAVQFVINPPRSPAEMSMASVLLGAFTTISAACLAGVLVVARRRRAWGRLRRASQWKLAWAIFIAVGLVHAAFGAFIVTWID